jgi:acylphosphatase
MVGDDATIRRRLVVRGRVQGVWYRESCREVAERLGVTGHVRNLGDGTVEVVAEGSPAAVDRLVDWCRHGPRRAVVVGVEDTTGRPEGLRRFRVR